MIVYEKRLCFAIKKCLAAFLWMYCKAIAKPNDADRSAPLLLRFSRVPVFHLQHDRQAHGAQALAPGLQIRIASETQILRGKLFGCRFLAEVIVQVFIERNGCHCIQPLQLLE